MKWILKIGKVDLGWIIFRERKTNEDISMAEYWNGLGWSDSKHNAKIYVIKTDVESAFIIIKSKICKSEDTSE